MNDETASKQEYRQKKENNEKLKIYRYKLKKKNIQTFKNREDRFVALHPLK